MEGRALPAGFTLIELVLTMLLIGILSAMAVPNFIDFRTDAKNAATKGALGGMRSAVSISIVAIKIREDSSTPQYPAFTEMTGNAFDANHPVLTGTSIMSSATGIPENPWTSSSAAAANRNKVFDCSALSKSDLLAFPNDDQGWCYNENTGQLWANSDLNGGGAGETENYY